jgi:hypothetical protein
MERHSSFDRYRLVARHASLPLARAIVKERAEIREEEVSLPLAFGIQLVRRVLQP